MYVVMSELQYLLLSSWKNRETDVACTLYRDIILSLLSIMIGIPRIRVAAYHLVPSLTPILNRQSLTCTSIKVLGHKELVG